MSATRADGSAIAKIPELHQKRVAAAFLINIQRWEAAEAAAAVGFRNAPDAAKWAAQMAELGHVADNGARRGPKRKISEAEASALGAALEEDKIGRGVERVAARQHASGNLAAASRRTYERALRRADFIPQMSTGDLPLTPAKEKARVKFANGVRDKRLGYRGSFSDSKIFEGGAIYRRGKARKCWAKRDKPRRESRKKPPYQVRPHSIFTRLRDCSLIADC